MIKIVSILALVALTFLPTRLYSINSDIDTLKRNIFRSKRENIPVINKINKDYIIRVKKSTGKTNPLEYHGFVAEVNNFYSPGNIELMDRQISADYIFQFKNRAHLDILNNLMYIILQKEYDPTNSGEHYLPAGSSQEGYEFALNFTSDNRKLFKYLIHSGYGDYYNGKQWFVEGNLNYRVQPYGYISLVYSYNLMLPAPWDYCLSELSSMNLLQISYSLPLMSNITNRPTI